MKGREFEEQNIVNYFKNIYNTGEYNPGWFRTILSFICSYILVKSTICIKKYAFLRKLIRSLTVKHIKKKAGIFTSDEMGRSLIDQFNNDEPKELNKKVVITLL